MGDPSKSSICFKALGARCPQHMHILCCEGDLHLPRSSLHLVVIVSSATATSVAAATTAAATAKGAATETRGRLSGLTLHSAHKPQQSLLEYKSHFSKATVFMLSPTTNHF